MPRKFLSPPIIDLLGDLAHNERLRLEHQVKVLDDSQIILELEHNHIAGLVYLWLKDTDSLRLLPDRRIQPLKSFYIRQWLRIERLQIEIDQIRSAFEQAQQDFILLKGPHVSKRFYEGADMRAVADIDLMVRDKDLQTACATVESCGYLRTSLMPLGPKLTRYFNHYVDYAKGDIPLDLHHSMRVHPAIRIDNDFLWSKTGRLEIKGKIYKVLNDEHILLMQLLAIHFDIARGQIRFRSFLDLLMMIRGVDNEIDWQAFLERRKRDGTKRLCAAVLSLCLSVFNSRYRYPKLDQEISRPSGRMLDFQDRRQCIRFITNANRPKCILFWAKLLEWPTVLTILWWIGSFPVRYASCQSNLLPRLITSISRRFNDIK